MYRKSLFQQNILSILFSSIILGCGLRFKAVAAFHLVIFLFCFFDFMIVGFGEYKLKVSMKDIIILFLFLTLGTFVFYFSEDPSNNGLIYYLVMFIQPILYFFIPRLYMINLRYDFIIKILFRTYKIVIFYLILEVVFRFSSLLSAFLSRDFIALYTGLKTSSFAYSDCNFLGMFIIFMLCLTLYLYDITKDKRFQKYARILNILCFTSISRSAMVTLIAIYYLRFLYKEFKKKHFLFLVLNLMVIPVIIFFTFNLFMNDASFRSKLDIFRGLKKIYSYDLRNALWGFGFGRGEYAYSYIRGGYAHVHLGMMLGQIGIIGTSVVILFFIYIYWFSYKKCFFILFAYILTGFSLEFRDSSLFLVMAIITTIEQKRKLSMISTFNADMKVKKM